MRYRRYRRRHSKGLDGLFGLLFLAAVALFSLGVALRVALYVLPALMCSVVLYKLWKVPAKRRWIGVFITLTLWGYVVGSPWNNKQQLDLKLIVPAFKHAQVGAKYVDSKVGTVIYGKTSLREFKLYLWAIPLLALLIMFFCMSPARKQIRYKTEDGYIVIETGELEHRWLAERHLGRSLNEDEVVHHINGRRNDNALENLCVLKRDKHEFFHAWLSWHKEKKGYYPSIREQELVLKNEYGGQLLF